MESWIVTVYTPSCIAIFIFYFIFVLLDDNWTKWNQLKGYFPSCYTLWQLAFAHMFIIGEWDAEAQCGLTEQITWSWHFNSKWLKEIWNCVVINCDQTLAKSQNHRSGFVKQTSLSYRPSTDCLLSLRQCFTLEWWYVTSCGQSECLYSIQTSIWAKREKIKEFLWFRNLEKLTFYADSPSLFGLGLGRSDFNIKKNIYLNSI